MHHGVFSYFLNCHASVLLNFLSRFCLSNLTLCRNSSQPEGETDDFRVISPSCGLVLWTTVRSLSWRLNDEESWKLGRYFMWDRWTWERSTAAKSSLSTRQPQQLDLVDLVTWLGRVIAGLSLSLINDVGFISRWNPLSWDSNERRLL